MILDTLDNAERYLSLHPLFPEAFHHLNQHVEWLAKPGKHPIKGDDLLIIVETSEGKTRTGARLETHRRYLDIQFVVKGSEEIGWKPLQDCKTESVAYVPEKDISFYSDSPSHWLPIPEGHFAIFYPEDAHAPLASSGPVTKIIMKVAVGDI